MHKFAMLLAIVLFASTVSACASNTDSTSTASSGSVSEATTSVINNIPEAESTITNYTKTNANKASEPWERAFFDLLSSAVMSNDDVFPSSFGVYYLDDGPLIAVAYLNKSDGKEWPGSMRVDKYELYNYVDSHANLIYTSQDDEELYEHNRFPQNAATDYALPDYVLTFWERNSTLTQSQVLERLADYFLHLYQPSVPKDAPLWVAEYVRHYRMHYEFTYIPNASISINEWKYDAETPGFTLHKLFIGDADTPLLSAIIHGVDEDTSWWGIHHFLVDGHLRTITAVNLRNP